MKKTMIIFALGLAFGSFAFAADDCKSVPDVNVHPIRSSADGTVRVETGRGRLAFFTTEDERNKGLLRNYISLATEAMISGRQLCWRQSGGVYLE